ncbi:SprT family protein [Alkalibacterium kapii]|nr:SprT family protein [Alkalibacterium kapii]
METEELQELVETVSLNFFDRPFRHKAVFNKRLRTTGGRYHLKTHNLDFNPKLLLKTDENTLVGVIKHELCHYHLHLSGEGYQHKDKTFKKLLKEVGGLRFTPSLTGKNEPKRVLKYQCLTCKTVVKRQRCFDTDKYVCAKCRGKLQFVEPIKS